MKTLKLCVLGLFILYGCTAPPKEENVNDAPHAEKVPHEVIANGNARTDNYYWMKLTDEQKNAEIKDEQTKKTLDYLNEENAYLKKKLAHTEAFQEKLGQKQQEIEQAKQQKSQKLAEKSARIMEDMQGKLRDFMNEYNKGKKYTLIFTTGAGLDYFLYKDSSLNITSEIVKGLNIKMK